MEYQIWCRLVIAFYISFNYLVHQKVKITRARFPHNLIWLISLNPKYFRFKKNVFLSNLSGMLKPKYIVYLCMYSIISCIC